MVFSVSPRSKKHRGAASTTTTTPALLLLFFTSKRAATMEVNVRNTENIREDNTAVSEAKKRKKSKFRALIMVILLSARLF